MVFQVNNVFRAVCKRGLHKRQFYQRILTGWHSKASSGLWIQCTFTQLGIRCFRSRRYPVTGAW